jgi:hypothetical protein
MRISIIVLCAVLISIPVFGCGTFQTGKTVAIDNPLESSRTTKSLNDARRDVKESRRLLDECLKKNEDDDTKCEVQKENYDRDVEAYVSIQTR